MASPHTAGTVTRPSDSTQETQASDFLAKRKLSRATLVKLPVARGTKFFPKSNKNLPAIVFKYKQGWQARAIGEKEFIAEKGWKPKFWNLEAVLSGQLDTVFITEGQLDAAALVESGIHESKVLSVPNGAKERTETSELRGYDYVYEALEAGLKKAKRFVWCGDNDAPGLALRADMVRILGASRFWFVDWPEGCKDANDYLISDGKEALFERVTEGALQWPVDGLYRLCELPEPPPLTIWNPGFPEWGNRIRLAARTLEVTTGLPGSGKTLLMNQIFYNVVRDYDLVMASASFETRPKPHVRRQLRTLISGKLEKDMDETWKRKADAWINDHFLFISHPDQRPTLEWFLDMAEVAVIRHGAKIIRLDPWNRMEDTKSERESQTAYIGRCLKTIHAFAHDMNVHVQIIAHPSKLEGNRRGQAPLLEDISDSAHWYNMVDQGFVVHRPKRFENGQRCFEAELYHRKSRFEELGHDCKIKLTYNAEIGKYFTNEALAEAA